MTTNSKTKEEQNDERQIKILIKALKASGLEVRREKLARGDSFRVKSGACHFSGQNIIFIDSRLQTQQQLSILVDSIVERQIDLNLQNIQGLSPSVRSLLLK
jgi:hypothetical protein